MKYFRYSLLTIILSIFYNQFAFAQDSIIFNALKDELNRNMKELGRDEEYVPPCFMKFGLSDYEYNLVTASLGSISSYRDSKNRNKSVRVMVGDYYLSDENFDDNTGNPNHNDGNIILALENNYTSIRRSYWITANNVYKNASELYRNKISAMKLKGLTREDLPAPDLSKEDSVVYKNSPYKDDYNDEAAIEKVKKASLVFQDYPEIHYSQVSLYRINSTEYVVNSEGTELSIPYKMYFIHVAAIMPDEDLHPIWQQMVYYARGFEKLANDTVIANDIHRLASNLYTGSKAEKFSEKYIGPVMLEGFAVVEEGFMNLFNAGNESLLASRAPLVNNRQDGLVVPNVQTWENRIGNRVIDKKLSIKDISTSTSYKGEPLLGHFEIDMQGVKPADTLVLVDDGILQTQLVNRTPTGKQHKSTGHMRLGMTERSTMNMLAPGVVLVESDQTISNREIKQKLMELGQEEGLDIVLYAKTIETNANISPVNYYKINVETGEETLLRGVRFSLDVNDMRDVEYISDNKRAFNTLFYRRGPGYIRGVPVTFITPDALIIKETEISGNVNTIKGELPLVPSPLYLQK